MSETSIWSGEILSLGEGPLTHHLRGSLIWVDINEARLYERAWDENITRVTVLEVLPSAAGIVCLLYTSPSPRDATLSRMPSSA